MWTRLSNDQMKSAEESGAGTDEPSVSRYSTWPASPNRLLQDSRHSGLRSTSFTERDSAISVSLHRPCPASDLDDVTVGSETWDRKGLQKAALPTAVRHAAVGGHPRPLIAVLGPRVTSPQTSRFHSIVGTSEPSASSFEPAERQ